MLLMNLLQFRIISGMNYAIRSSLYLLLLILDNIVSSDRVSVSSKVSQYRTIQNLKQFQLRNDSTRMHITVKNLSKATDRLTDYCYY